MDRVNGARSDFSGRAGALRAAASVEAPIAVAAREIQSDACVRAVLVSVSACAPPPLLQRPAGRPRPRSRCSCWARGARRRTCTSPSPPPRAPPAQRPVSAARGPNSTGPIINNNISRRRVTPRKIFQCSLSKRIITKVTT